MDSNCTPHFIPPKLLSKDGKLHHVGNNYHLVEKITTTFKNELPVENYFPLSSWRKNPLLFDIRIGLQQALALASLFTPS